MTKHIPELRSYKHQQLMNDYNDMQIRIKVHLFDVNNNGIKLRYPKPTVLELDELLNKVISALQEDSKPMRRN